MRNLVVCCDGTWNTADQNEGGIPTPTNVVKLFRCVKDTGSDDIEQLKYYHPGVGTNGLIDSLVGGSLGVGISDNIQGAYHWLARNYTSGDRIYLFGFSRGAYTVRSLAGMINKCGLIDLNSNVSSRDGWSRVKKVYSMYRNRDLQDVEHEYSLLIEKRKEDGVHFLGVWDTVGALGIPNELNILDRFDKPSNWMFHDVKLGANVSMARHAVAIDEKRSGFTPTLWDEDHADMKQTWFAGVHSDIGGGYLESGLADIALKWMIDEASSATGGLHFDSDLVSQIESTEFRSLLHDSYKGFFGKLRSQPRCVPNLLTSEHVHPAAKLRSEKPPLLQAPYWETNALAINESYSVDVFAAERWNNTGIYLEAGEYECEASGEWLDKGIPCGPIGMRDGEFHLDEVSHFIGSLFGKVERVLNNENEHADYKFTKRHEDVDWFALTGAIAYKTDSPQMDGTPELYAAQALVTEMDGGIAKGQLKVTKPGYLYAYANDAWNMYENNKGSVELKITRTQ